MMKHNKKISRIKKRCLRYFREHIQTIDNEYNGYLTKAGLLHKSKTNHLTKIATVKAIYLETVRIPFINGSLITMYPHDFYSVMFTQEEILQHIADEKNRRKTNSTMRVVFLDEYDYCDK